MQIKEDKKMEIQQNSQILKIDVEQNFEQMLAYLYLYCFEFVSDGIFIPSLNIPADGDIRPSENFFETEHIISFKKSIKLSIHDKSLTLCFDNAKDATEFKDELERTW